MRGLSPQLTVQVLLTVPSFPLWPPWWPSPGSLGVVLLVIIAASSKCPVFHPGLLLLGWSVSTAGAEGSARPRESFAKQD